MQSSKMLLLTYCNPYIYHSGHTLDFAPAFRYPVSISHVSLTFPVAETPNPCP